MKIYHKDIGFPSNLLLLDMYVNLKYSRHAIKKNEELKHKLEITKELVRIKASEIIELHITKKGWLKKIVLRTAYNNKKDIIFVIELFLFSMKAKVVTFWLNNKKDKHYTLDKTKYTKP